MKYIIKGKLLSGQCSSSGGQKPDVLSGLSAENKIAIRCDGVKIEIVGIRFAGAAVAFVHRVSRSPSANTLCIRAEPAGCQ